MLRFIKEKIKQFKSRLIVGALVSLPFVANAGDLFTPGAGDKAIELLGGLFGKLGVFGGGASDAFAGVMGYFNTACLLIGGVLVGYTMIAGTLGTAHDGEMLGKKFSSIWVPIRTSLGTAMVIPIKSGYCALQLIVGWLVFQSVGLASHTWSQYMASTNIAQGIVMSMPNSSLERFYWGTLEIQVCQAALEKAVKDPSAKNLYSNVDLGMTTLNNATNIRYQFGDKAETAGLAYDTCGSIEIPKISQINKGGDGSIIDKNDIVAIRQTIQQQQQTMLVQAMPQIKAVAAQIVASNSPVDPSAIQSLVLAHEKAIKAAATSAVTNMDAFKNLQKSAETDGFLLAGAYYMKLAYLSDQVNAAISSVPKVIPPVGMQETAFVRDQVLPYTRAVKKTLEKAGQPGSYGLATVGVDPKEDKTMWEKFKSYTDVETYLKSSLRSVLSFSIEGNENPIMTLKRLGNNIIGAAGLLITGLMTAMVLVGIHPGVTGALTVLVNIAGAPLLMLGMFLSYVVPNMPFFIWLGCILGWLLLVIEAIIAAPIWAVMHLHPSGDDAVGKGGNGYTLVLSLLLRPVFLVFGFIASITVVQLFGQIFNSIFADVFVMNTMDGSNIFVILAGFVAGAIMYAAGVWVIVKNTFGIISQIPDNLLNWISSPTGQLGKNAESMGGMSSGAYAGISEGSKMAGNVAQMASGKLAEHGKQMADKDKADDRAGEGMDQKYGNGTASSIEQLLSKSHKTGGKLEETGLSGYEGQMKQAMLDKALSKVGGPDTEAGNAFMDAFKESVASKGQNLPMEDHLKAGLESGMSRMYGEGSMQMAQSLDTNSLEDSDFSKSSVNSNNFGRALNVMDNFRNDIMRGGFSQEQANEIMEKTYDRVQDTYKNSPDSVMNGGSMNVREVFSQERKGIEKEFGINRGKGHGKLSKPE